MTPARAVLLGAFLATITLLLAVGATIRLPAQAPAGSAPTATVPRPAR